MSVSARRVALGEVGVRRRIAAKCLSRGLPDRLLEAHLDLEGRTANPLFITEHVEGAPALSPDGTLLAYVSDRTGSREVYVRTFPAGNEVQVSTNRGLNPTWSVDGSDLFFQAEAMTRIFAAAIRTEPQLQVLGREELFSATPFWMGVTGAPYDQAADGRFLMIRHRDPTDPPDRLEVILNFSERLKRLAPGER